MGLSIDELINFSKVRLVTHYARFTDNAANSNLAFVAPSIEGKDAKGLLITPQGELVFAGVDKDNFHAAIMNIAFLLNGHQTDPDAQESIRSFINKTVTKKLLGGDTGRIKDFAEAMLVDGVLPDMEERKRVADTIRKAIERTGEKKGKTALNADNTKLLALATIIEEPSITHDWVSEFERFAARRHKAWENAPLRQLLKQIVVPGPEGKDVVLTPLGSLPLMRRVGRLAKTVEEIARANGTSSHPSVRKFKRMATIGKNRSFGNSQNSGLSYKGFNAIRHRLNLNSYEMVIDDARRVLRGKIGELATAIRKRRVYLSEQGVSVASNAERTDIKTEIIRLSKKVALDFMYNLEQSINFANEDDAFHWVAKEVKKAVNEENKTYQAAKLTMSEAMLIEAGVSEVIDMFYGEPSAAKEYP